MMIFVSWYTHILDVLIFWKPENVMAEMQGCHALKQFMRKGGMSFSRIL